jgi:hypothetical protein
VFARRNPQFSSNMASGNHERRPSRETEGLPGLRLGDGASPIKERKASTAGKFVDEEALAMYVENEDDHDIKYRTLTWKKVRK